MQVGLVMASSTFHRLPADVLSDILQHLLAKDLCRLRTVCRSWRSITSNQDFISAHADRHREPLFLAKFQDDDEHVYVVDLSGDVVKRIAGAEDGHRVQRTRLSLACLATDWNTCRLLDPATGRIQVLPLIPGENDVDDDFWQKPCTFFALGFVANTGEYKLLRCSRPFVEFGLQVQVLTMNNDGGGNNWRSAGPGPGGSIIDMQSGIVVEGVVYFLKLQGYGSNDPADDIVSFDLAGEEWRRDLRGPLSSSDVAPAEFGWAQLTLAELEGSLVLAHRYHRPLSVLNLWFLQDFESGLWVKEYSIRTDSVSSTLTTDDIHYIIPLLALNDGRLVIYLAPAGLLHICDPGTNTFTRVHMRGRLLDSVGVYTGSLLSLQG